MQQTTKTTSQPARSFRRLTALCVASALAFLSVGVDAEESPSEVGILAADNAPGSLDAAERLADGLNARGAVVYDGEAMRLKLDRTLVDPAEQGSTPAGLTESISRGIRQFFYQSRRDAVETLRKAVDRGLHHLPALARRPDLADQVYEAGIVLVRAARITETPGSSGDASTSLARETVQRLATHFPTRTPSMETAPPEIVDLFEKAHAKTATQETVLELEVPNNCTATLNGMAAGGSTIAVAPDAPYLIRLDCGGKTSRLRSVALRRGDRRLLPLFMGEPIPEGQAAFDGTSPFGESIAENQLRRALAWSGVDSLLAVHQRGRGPSRRTTVTHLASGGSPTSTTWEGRFDAEAYLNETFDLGPSADSDRSVAEVPIDGGGGRGLDIGLVAAGGVSVAASSWLLVAAAKNQRLLRCSANASDPLPSSRCEGASTRGVTLTPAATDTREAQVNRQRILGITLGAVGVAGATWGLIRMLTASEKPQTADHDRATTHVVFTNRSASLVITF
jgi:hypothetical protein